MPVKVYPDTIIYIVCPAHHTSGGPEALHQLYFKLKMLGYAASMFYTDQKGPNPVPDRYLPYQVTYSAEIEDSASHLVIVPEVRTKLLNKYQHVRKAIWWLSIDNYFKVLTKRLKLINSLKHKVWGSTCANFLGFDTGKFQASTYFHFAQSKYAFDFLRTKGIQQVFMLSDYLTVDYLQDVRIQEKKNRIIYNPLKGIKNTMLLMKARPDLDWVPLQNMTLSQVKDMLASSKVYIDFGHHPGKDRLPREAAVNGCCVITGKEGSAANAVDVEIPEQYKFKDVSKQANAILALIEVCFARFEHHQQDFLPYIAKIKKEEAEFEREVAAIFYR